MINQKMYKQYKTVLQRPFSDKRKFEFEPRMQNPAVTARIRILLVSF